MIKPRNKSFYDWCLETNNKGFLERWNYELNECSPKDVAFMWKPRTPVTLVMG